MGLPGILAEIAEVAGEDAALALASARGGTEIYLPPVPANDHWLSRLVGSEAARKIGDRLTAGGRGTRVEVPLGPAGDQAKRRALLDQLLPTQMSERDIARRTGYTVGAVRKRRRKLGVVRDDGQLNLF